MSEQGNRLAEAGLALVTARIIPFPPRRSHGRDAVRGKVAQLRPSIVSGDGLAMLTAVNAARTWWAAYSIATATADDDGTFSHLVDGWNTLMRLVAQAPATSLAGVLAKADLAAWTKGEGHGDAEWDADLWQTLAEGIVACRPVIAAAGAPRHD